MKQKRKVKSLISSNGENKNLLTTLLFLAGGVLLFGALALIASIGGVASAESSDVIEYPGIDDKKEVLLRFGLIPEGGNTAVNEMFLTGKTFFVNGSAGLSVDDTAGMSLGAGKYINFLGGRPDGANIDSNNVTIIGGSQAKILENNDNTTFLGGNSNTVNPGTNSVSPVMLGGQNNIIGSNQEGSAIIGGRNNEIGGSASYDFILGGENNNIESNSKNAIVGGARVTVDGGKSNLFAFSAEGTEFKPQGSNAFYLNVQHGLGLNKAASNLSENNLGIDSNGAVSFGPIDITSSARKCTASDVGVQGSWEGCLVGCTKLGADNGGKWEMVDHGDKCKRLCELNSAYCMMSPIEPAKPDPYTSYCTTNGVDTGHSHHCGGEALILPNYQNVLFETMLIDSDDSCPKPGTSNWTENRCVFKCDGEYHLTGDKTGMGGRTKCYKDCKLPWDGTKIKHNETRIAYNTDETYCAFPSGSPASPHTCANHKATIICQNGTLYVQKSNGQADTTKPAITNGYVYSGCMLNQYRCNTDVYNYTASDITNTSKFNDKVTTWNLTDRGQTNGVRGKYKLCIDYNTNPNTVQQLNGEKCDALNLNTSVNPKRYTTHYQWVGCQTNYHTGAGYENVCMKDCTLKKTNNQTQYYRHNTTVVGYKTKEKTCTDKCEFTTLVCNDGEWRLGSLNGTKTTAYVYNDCTLKDKTCASKYNVTETEKQTYESTSIYDNWCDPYKANNTDKVTCTKQSTKYELTDCKSGYHTVNGKWCVSNSKQVNCNTTNVDKPDNSSFNVVLVWVSWKSSCGWKGQDATCWNSPADCGWSCNTNYHQEGSFLCCHDGEHSDSGTCTSNTSSAPCVQAGGVANSEYVIENVPITYNESNGTWSTPRNCNWVCEEGYTRNGDQCDKNPDPIVGLCGTVKYTCRAGASTGETVTETEYQWVCAGLNGGANSQPCTASRSQDGWCKGTHWECYVGDSEDNSESDDEYTWTCKGINEGSDDYCSEEKPQKVDGQCGEALDQCTSGTYEDVADTTTEYKWNCVGLNEGTTANCSKSIGGNCDVICGSKANQCLVGGHDKGPNNPQQNGSNHGDSTTYTWQCSGEYGCPDYGTIVQNCSCENTSCSSQGLSNSHDACYSDAPLASDVYGCGMGDVSCYKNGCAANGYNGYTCYSDVSDLSTDEYDIHSLDHGYCAKKTCTAVNGQCNTSTQFACTVGTSIDNETLTNEWKWKCVGLCGGTTASCSKDRPEDLECGTTHYSCKGGTSTNNVPGTNGWTWKCTSSNGLNSVDCSEDCPEGQTIQNGECKSSAITINICPKPEFGTCNTSVASNCYNGSALSNLSFESDKPLPKNIGIKAEFTYHVTSLGESCNYSNTSMDATYTISNGETTSSIGGGHSNVLGTNETTCIGSFGYGKYFDSSYDYNFTSTSSKSYSFTLNGQEYNLKLNGSCGGSTHTITPDLKPECGNSLSNKCAIGEVKNYNSTTNTWNCENSAGSIQCNYLCMSTYSCPKGYRLTSDNRCELYYQFCAEKVVCTNDNIGKYGCTVDNAVENPYNEACGASDGCFGDVSQGPYAHHDCVWGASSLEWTTSWTPGAGWGGYEYYYLTPYEDYDASGPECGYNDVMLDVLLEKCKTLVHADSSNGNGYVITRDSCAVSTYDRADPCVEQTSCTVAEWVSP